MIKPVVLDYSLGTSALYTSNDSRGELIKGVTQVELRSHSKFICRGVSNYALAAPSEAQTVSVNGRAMYLNRVKLRCSIDGNEEIMDYTLNHLGGNVILHSKKICGVVESICATDTAIEIIVLSVTDSKIEASRKLLNPYTRFILFDTSESEGLFGCLNVNSISTITKEATYGDSRIVYNREVGYEIDIPLRKIRVEDVDGSYSHADIVYFQQYGNDIQLKNVNQANIQEQVGTLEVNELKLARVAFIVSPSTKRLLAKGNAYYFDLKVELI